MTKTFSLLALIAAIMLGTFTVPAISLAQEAPASNTPNYYGQAPTGEVPWRIRFFEAAIIEGDTVLLGEVAIPAGEIPPALWEQYKKRPLWPAPPANKGAVNMTRPKLQEAVVHTMKDLAPYCLFPGSMALQRGGAVVDRATIQQTVTKELTPYLAALPGETTLSDFRLPQSIFLEHQGQTLQLEEIKKISAGRTSVRLLVKELDGKVVQKISGSVFIDCWTEVPSAAAPLNRDDILTPDKITFVRQNLAHLKGNIWDGRGGPWRVVRPLGVQQVIYQNDLSYIPTVRKGSIVTLTYIGNSITLTTQAEALADGSVGENIAVRNLQSKKEVFAVIKDASSVVIQSQR